MWYCRGRTDPNWFAVQAAGPRIGQGWQEALCLAWRGVVQQLQSMWVLFRSTLFCTLPLLQKSGRVTTTYLLLRLPARLGSHPDQSHPHSSPGCKFFGHPSFDR